MPTCAPTSSPHGPSWRPRTSSRPDASAGEVAGANIDSPGPAAPFLARPGEARSGPPGGFRIRAAGRPGRRRPRGFEGVMTTLTLRRDHDRLAMAALVFGALVIG